nr:putative glucose-6-phosphate 1-epimerase [Tanacetum cinerariifolium]
FELRLRVCLGLNGNLALTSRTNINCKPFRFSFAYHSYLSVSDIGEFDRVYLGSPNIVAVLDHERKQTYLIRREGLSDVVVWNPWDKKAKAMTDMGFDEYRRMFDRVYLGSPNIVSVLDHERKKTYVIRREGLSDV